jgi:hypothetical protein
LPAPQLDLVGHQLPPFHDQCAFGAPAFPVWAHSLQKICICLIALFTYFNAPPPLCDHVFDHM